MPSTARQYQGESAENRARARRQKLIESGFELMSASGWRHVTIDSLCQAAKLNKRYFYESFADLDALADAVVDDLASSLLSLGLAAAQSAQSAGMSTEALARHVMGSVIGWLVEDPRRARVLFSEVNHSARAMDQRKFVIRQLAHELTVFSHKYHGATQSHPIAQAGAALLIGGSIETLLSWLDDDIGMSQEELVDAVARFWVAIGNAAIATVQAGPTDHP